MPTFDCIYSFPYHNVSLSCFVWTDLMCLPFTGINWPWCFPFLSNSLTALNLWSSWAFLELCSTSCIALLYLRGTFFMNMSLIRWCFPLSAHKHIENWSNALCVFIWQSFPVEKVRDVLSRVPMAQKFAKYWICQARIMEREGNLEVLPMFQEAIREVREVSLSLSLKHAHSFFFLLMVLSFACCFFCFSLIMWEASEELKRKIDIVGMLIINCLIVNRQ